MLKIDNKEIEIDLQQIKVGEFINNGVKGYNINVQLLFNGNGYLNLSAGFEKTNDIINFLNKEYIGIPYDDSEIDFFEVYDTYKFLDTEVESKITLKINNIVDNKIEAYIELNDELIKIKYDGYLDII